MNGARHAREHLLSWPDLTGGQASCGSASSLRSGDLEIVHFHGEEQADVHLPPHLIAKLRPALARSSAVRLHPHSGWVTVRLEVGSDIELLATLVSAALRTHPPTAQLARPGALPDRCSRQWLRAVVAPCATGS
ncbi:luciferase family protein [Streptomyces sp. NPDC060194]|uniref:luciferase domain-containing protein n=1 Tax=Streptomyces sp. NPDC060194 TaxID=3347069 RepID=UPI003653CE4A